MEQKKKTNIVAVRVDEDLYNKIKQQAELEHREMSEFVRHTVQVYLEKVEEVRRITL